MIFTMRRVFGGLPRQDLSLFLLRPLSSSFRIAFTGWKNSTADVWTQNILLQSPQTWPNNLNKFLLFHSSAALSSRDPKRGSYDYCSQREPVSIPITRVPVSYPSTRVPLNTICASWNREINESLSLIFMSRVVYAYLKYRQTTSTPILWCGERTLLPCILDSCTWRWSTWEFHQLLFLQKDCTLKLTILSADDGPVWKRHQLTCSCFCQRTWHCWLLSDS